MIPLIDVVFNVLAFFISATLAMSIQRGVQVTLPAGAGGSRELGIVITLDRENRLYLEDRRVSPEQILQAVTSRLSAGELSVLIRGDSRADLGVAVELLARLRAAGIKAVSFQVQEGP